MHIIIIGNPVDGFEHIGPFPTFDDAHRNATMDGDIDGSDWWISELTPPNNPTE